MSGQGDRVWWREIVGGENQTQQVEWTSLEQDECRARLGLSWARYSSSRRPHSIRWCISTCWRTRSGLRSDLPGWSNSTHYCHCERGAELQVRGEGDQWSVGLLPSSGHPGAQTCSLWTFGSGQSVELRRIPPVSIQNLKVNVQDFATAWRRKDIKALSIILPIAFCCQNVFISKEILEKQFQKTEIFGENFGWWNW